MGAARLSAVLALAALAGNASAQETGDWLELFNGENLDGWIPKVRGYPVGENPHATFRVTDGLLTVSYAGYEHFDNRFGHLFYHEPYSHYRIRIEYRFVGDPATGTEPWAFRNSGAMLHSQPPASMLPPQDFPISLEMQFLGGLVEGEARPTGNLCTPGTHVVIDGRFDDTHCITADAPTIYGDGWVLAEALVLGDERIVHYIEGVPVIEFAQPTTGGGVVHDYDPAKKPEGEPLDRGHIALQSEGHAIQFRRVELLNLRGCMDPDAGNYRDYYVANDADSCRFAGLSRP